MVKDGGLLRTIGICLSPSIPYLRAWKRYHEAVLDVLKRKPYNLRKDGTKEYVHSGACFRSTLHCQPGDVGHDSI